MSDCFVRVNGYYFADRAYCWTNQSDAAARYPYDVGVGVARYWRKGNAYLCGFSCVEVEVVCAEDLSVCEAKDEKRIAEVRALEAEVEARRRKSEEKAAKAKENA